jgi:hypothetical protein
VFHKGASQSGRIRHEWSQGRQAFRDRSFAYSLALVFPKQLWWTTVEKAGRSRRRPHLSSLLAPGFPTHRSMGVVTTSVSASSLLCQSPADRLSKSPALDTDGQAPDRGGSADATDAPGRTRHEPMSHDRPSSDGENKSSQTPRRSEGEKPTPLRKPFYTRPLLMTVLAVVLLGGTIAGVRYWQYARQYVSTDDAFIQGHIIQISPKVSAQVMQVLIDDNQEVKQGDLLVELDPRGFEVALEQAQTNEAAARGRLQQVQARLAVAKANVAQARA